MTLPQAVEAGRLALGHPPASYDTLLLDAIEALHQGGYRDAFLLAAVSMDHLARKKAAEALESAFGDTQDQALRIGFGPAPSSSPQAERKEALFKLLLGDRRFDALLHKVPFALTGRSVLRDDKPLYDTALRAYKRRNRVVHEELTFVDEFSRFSGFEEATEAITCAIALVDWFGEPAGYRHAFEKEAAIVCRVAMA